MHLGDAIGESADLDTEIELRIDATWANARGYSLIFYGRRNARLFLMIRLFKVEKVEAELYVPRGLHAIRTLAACVPQTTTSIACNLLSALGPYRVQPL